MAVQPGDTTGLVRSVRDLSVVDSPRADAVRSPQAPTPPATGDRPRVSGGRPPAEPLSPWGRLTSWFGQRPPWQLWLVLGVVALALMLLRRPAALLNPTIWAEDGRVFIAGALNGATPWESYAGQLWVPERLLGSAVATAPATWWPWLLYLVSAICVVAPAVVVLASRAGEALGPVWARALALMGLVLLPGAWEVQGNVCNLHWYWTAIALVLLTGRPPGSSRWRAVELVALGLVAMSGYTAVILLPAAAWAQVRRRAPGTLARLLVVGAGAALALSQAIGASRAPGSPPGEALRAAPLVGVVRIGGTWVLGESGLARLWSGWSWWSAAVLVPAIVLLALLAALVIMDIAGPSPVWAGTGLLCVALGLFGTPGGRPWDLLSAYEGGRYFALALMAALLVVARAVGTGTDRRRVVALVAGALMLAGAVSDAVLPPMGHEVSSAALQAFEDCASGAEAPPNGTGLCLVHVSPDGPDWWIGTRAGSR